LGWGWRRRFGCGWLFAALLGMIILLVLARLVFRLF
jgi:hypothetical protein